MLARQTEWPMTQAGFRTSRHLPAISGWEALIHKSELHKHESYRLGCTNLSSGVADKQLVGDDESFVVTNH